MKSNLKWIFFLVASWYANVATAQLSWVNVDSLYQPLPASVHIYYTESKMDTAPFRAYYLIADLKNRNLDFSADTTHNRRLTPTAFYERNNQIKKAPGQYGSDADKKEMEADGDKLV